ncbi:MAG: DUF4330 domain-containing protein [Lutisporaceae bacterium]
MFIDQKGRLFGKINVIDLLAVLVAALIIAGVLYKFVLSENRGVGNDTLIQYTVSITDIRNFTVDAVNVEDDMYDSKTDTYMGKVISKEVKPFKDYITKTDGTVALAEKPGKFELLLTIQVPGVVNNYSYLASGNRDINNQSTVFLENRVVEIQGKVVDVRKK